MKSSWKIIIRSMRFSLALVLAMVAAWVPVGAWAGEATAQAMPTAQGERTSIAGDPYRWDLSPSILTRDEVEDVGKLVRVGRTDSERVPELKLGRDYVVDTPAVDKTTGLGTAVVRGIGDYMGEVKVGFKEVDALDLGDAVVTFTLYQSKKGAFIPGDHLATGERIMPEVRDVFFSWTGDDYSLDYSRHLGASDYKVTYGQNTDSGKGSVTIEPSGNGVCVGGLVKEFDIVRREDFAIDGTGGGVYRTSVVLDENTEWTVASRPALPYLGEPVRPEVTLWVTKNDGHSTVTNIELVEGRDYTLSYRNNDGPGTARVTATGINGITGSVSLDFQVVGDGG